MKKYLKMFLTFVTLMVLGWNFARPMRIFGDCMEPAIRDGKVHFLNHVLPFFRNYKIEDIVVFSYEDKEWISRVVALENDSIRIVNGSIIVNGAPLQEGNITNEEYNKIIDEVK